MNNPVSFIYSRSIVVTILMFLICVLLAKFTSVRNFGVKMIFIFCSLISFIFMVNNIKSNFVQNSDKSIYASATTSVTEAVAEDMFSQLCEELGVAGGKSSFDKMVDELFSVSVY